VEPTTFSQHNMDYTSLDFHMEPTTLSLLKGHVLRGYGEKNVYSGQVVHWPALTFPLQGAEIILRYYLIWEVEQ
jgi:hypothetical protein